MEVLVIFSIAVKVFLFIINIFLMTKLIYPIILLYTMSVLLNKGMFVEYWYGGSLFYWAFYMLLLLSTIPFLKKVFNLLKGFYIKILGSFRR